MKSRISPMRVERRFSPCLRASVVILLLFQLDYFNSRREVSAILGTYKCHAKLLDDQTNSLLDRSKRRVDERFSLVDEGNLCVEDKIVRDETTNALVDPAIFMDE